MKKPLVVVTLAALLSLLLVTLLASLASGGFFPFLQTLDRPRPALFADFVAHYYPTSDQLLSNGRPTLGYYYPPSFAVWVLPFTWLEPTLSLWAWGLLQALSSLILSTLAGLAVWRFGRGYSWAAVGLTALSFPLWHNFRWGQMSVTLTALALAAALNWRRPGWKAPLLLAVASSIKALPALFALPWLLRGEWRRLLRYGVLSALLAVALPVLLMGPAKAWSFTMEVRQAAARALSTWVPADPNSQYLPYVVARWAAPEGGEPLWGVIPGLRIVGWLLFLVTLALVWRLSRRGPEPAGDEGDLLLIGLLFCALPLVLPTSWAHYFVYLPLVQVVALAKVAQLGSGAWRLLALVATGLSMFFASLPMFVVAGGQPRYTALGLLGVANFLMLAVLWAVGYLTSRQPRNVPQGLES